MPENARGTAPRPGFHESGYTEDRYSRYLEELDGYFGRSPGTDGEKLQHFAKYVPRGSLLRFLVKYEIFKLALEVQGSIVECGVLYGGGTMTWAQLSAILEPANHQRRVIGFDTFSGFARVSDQDSGSDSEHMHPGGFGVDSYTDLLECVAIHDGARHLGHIPKVELVRGDIAETLPQYLKANPHLVVSLLHLDFDLYEPTLVALRQLVPRIPRGGVIVFDELNVSLWPGETSAVAQEMGLSRLRLRRFPFGTSISYAVME